MVAARVAFATATTALLSSVEYWRPLIGEALVLLFSCPLHVGEKNVGCWLMFMALCGTGASRHESEGDSDHGSRQ